MKVLCTTIVIVISFLFSTLSFSQGEIIDDFSKKALPDWVWGGVEMKYSHSEDNKENGFAEIVSKKTFNGSGYIGKILLKKAHLFTVGNFFNVMLRGVNDDAAVKIQLLYDIDNNSTYNEDKDLMLTSKPISMNFDGWKEIKVKLDEENFQIVSSSQDNFAVTEENVYAIQLEFEAGKYYEDNDFESGIALISEIPNKETFSNQELGNSNKESYFSVRNYPNPFNPTTTITYILPQSTFVSINVYDRLGRQVVALIEQNQDAGEHSVEFNASEFPSGIYFYRIKTPEKTEVRKMLLTK